MLINHVVSQELSLALREAGYPQEGSTFYWVNGELWDETMQSDYETPATPPRYEWVACPLASELLERMPENCTIEKAREEADDAYVAIQFGETYKQNVVNPLHREYGPTAPDALAKLWLHLNKEGLLK